MKRTVFAAGAAIVGVGMVSPAIAADTGAYIMGGVGFNLHENYDDLAYIATAATGSSVKFDLNNGQAASLGLGYRFADGLRVEGELSYRKNNFDNFIFPTGTTVDLNGDMTSWSLMANALYEFESDSQWTPYVGAGAGLSRMRTSWSPAATPSFVVSGSDTVVAAQLIGGLDYEIDNNWSIGGRYNLLHRGDMKYSSAPTGVAIQYEHDSHLNHTLGVNLTYSFK